LVRHFTITVGYVEFFSSLSVYEAVAMWYPARDDIK
jgi:hypothetical protein